MMYKKRIADEELSFRLECSGAVLIEGPKWCGKTTTGIQQAQSVIKLQDSDQHERYQAIADVKPSMLLEGEHPRLIDEWQEIPLLWDAVRNSVDENNETGLYIMTGSNTVDTNQIKHSGTGRIARMRMDTMSLFESGESNGQVSLSELFAHPTMEIVVKSELSIEELIFVACRGGWPGYLARKTDRAQLQIARDYVTSVCSIDVSTIDGTKRNPLLAEQILRSYSRNVSTLAKDTSILQDVTASFETCSPVTFRSYVDALEKLFVIQDIDAWCPSIRSATAIRSSKKRGFCDPSIAVAAMGLSPDYYLKDLPSFGFVFESLCMRDLRVYSTGNEGRLSYYHDRYGLEADCVIHLRDGRYALCEFKLGNREIEEGSQHLLEIARLVRTFNETGKGPKLREPDLLLVVTGGEYGYRRRDGVYVIPIGCLRN
ncbi:MAG: ATP-binding protein [Spirochaetales bacterium]|nr:ATP-binding protein [Candidatus Physcosoma equi]